MYLAQDNLAADPSVKINIQHLWSTQSGAIKNSEGYLNDPYINFIVQNRLMGLIYGKKNKDSHMKNDMLKFESVNDVDRFEKT